MARIEQRYQGSFTIHTKKASCHVLAHKIQGIVRGWLIKSERKLFGANGCMIALNYARKCKIYSRRPGASSVETATHYADEGNAWCMRYVHKDGVKRGIEWVTELGLRLDKASNTLILSVMLTTSTTGEVYIRTGEHQEWTPSVPRFVREILLHPLIDHVSVNGIVLPLSSEIPEELKTKKIAARPWMTWVKTESDAERIVEILRNPARRFAVALIMGESEVAKREARELSNGLCGKSYVCIVNADWKVAKHFKVYEIPFDNVRLVLPFHMRESLSRHPIYAIHEDCRHKEARNRIVESQDGYATMFEEGAVYKLEDIAALNQISDYKKKNQAFRDAVEHRQLSDKEAKEMLEYAESVQQDYEREKKRNDELMRDRDEWKAMVSEMENECRQKLNDQQAKYEGMLRRRTANMEVPDRIPRCIKDLLLWIPLLTNLAIGENAWRGMVDRDKFDKINLVWNMLWHLNSTMHKLAFEEKGVELRKAFKERSGYDYTADENDDVKRKWPEGHVAVIDGKKFMCWRHIKRGNDDNNLVRIYFDFDAAHNRIVISWIGRHLRTNLSSQQ